MIHVTAGIMRIDREAFFFFFPRQSDKLKFVNMQIMFLLPIAESRIFNP